METKLKDILAISRRLKRIAALTWWVQSLYPEEEDRPVLVGAAALELHTEGAYLTADLDFVGTLPSVVTGKLKEAGFVQLDRQWLYEEESVSFVFRGEALRAGERAVEKSVENYSVLMVSPEDLLVDRLATWRRMRSPTHGVQAYLLYYVTHAAIDAEHLRRRAVQEDVVPALDSVIRLFFQIKGQIPDAEYLGIWASRGM